MTLDAMQFCWVPAGRFVMGSEEGDGDEKPQHKVDIAYDYWLARYPVTVAQWREYVAASGVKVGDPDSRVPGLWRISCRLGNSVWISSSVMRALRG